MGWEFEFGVSAGKPHGSNVGGDLVNGALFHLLSFMYQLVVVIPLCIVGLFIYRFLI